MKKSWSSRAYGRLIYRILVQKETPEQSGFLSEKISIYCTDNPPSLLRKPRMGKQVLCRGPVLGPPAQHSRNKVYKLGHSVVIINYFSHGDQVLFSNKLGEFELSYQIS